MDRAIWGVFMVAVDVESVFLKGLTLICIAELELEAAVLRGRCKLAECCDNYILPMSITLVHSTDILFFLANCSKLQKYNVVSQVYRANFLNKSSANTC